MFEKIDQAPVDEEDLLAIGKIAGGSGLDLATPLLTRVRDAGMKLKVLASKAPSRSPGQAGGTSLVAETGMGEQAERVRDVGYAASAPFEQFLKKHADQPDAVQFTIEIKILIPPMQHQRASGRYDVSHFFETLAHELAIHAEKYVNLVARYRQGKGWVTTSESVEHWLFAFRGQPRYLLWLRQLLKAGEQTTGTDQSPRALFERVRTELLDWTKAEHKELQSPPPTIKRVLAAESAPLSEEDLRALATYLPDLAQEDVVSVLQKAKDQKPTGWIDDIGRD